jgi:hypothetical protein
MAQLTLTGEVIAINDVPSVNVGVGRTLKNFDVLEDDEVARAARARQSGFGNKDAVPFPMSITVEEDPDDPADAFVIEEGDRVEVVGWTSTRQGHTYAFISARTKVEDITVTHKAAPQAEAADGETPKDANGDDIPF